MLAFFSMLGLLLAALGFAGAATKFTSPNLGIYLILGGLAWVALLLLPALFQTLKWGKRGMPTFSLLVGLLSLAALGGAGYLYYTHPLNDLTTNTLKPPAFLRPVYLFQPQAGAEFLDKSFELNRDYRSELTGLQNMHYSGLESISVKIPLAEATPLIEKTLRDNFPGWRIVHSEKTYPHVEAELENPFLHSIDDIVVEGRESKNNPAQIVVDYRIRNRFPLGDLGLSARRMEDIRAALAGPLAQAANKLAEQEKAKKAAIPAAPPPMPASDLTAPISTNSGLPPGRVP